MVGLPADLPNRQPVERKKPKPLDLGHIRMTRHGRVVEIECCSPRLVDDMIALICSPVGLYQVRILCGNGKYKVQNCMPLWSEAQRMAVLQSCVASAELVLEGFARQDGERVVHSAHVAAQKSLGSLQGW